MRLLIKSFVNFAEALQNDSLYRENALTFASDYDRSNPLTQASGAARLLNLQIERATKSGDLKTVENLIEQKHNVKTFNQLSAIEMYAESN